jgi:exopolysaccharide biosynthesis polyprenyl glycosylphosphotransferase
MRRDKFSQLWMPGLLMAGDAVFAFLGLCLAWWLRYRTPYGQIIVEVVDARFVDYLPLLGVGCGLLVLTFAQLGLCASGMILRRLHAVGLIFRATSLWLFAYLCLSLVLRFTPEISRLFVVIAAVTVLLCVSLWRQLLYQVVVGSPLLLRLRQRVVVYGWNDKASLLLAELSASGRHPFMVVGVLPRGDERPPSDLLLAPLEGEELYESLRRVRADVLICAEPGLPAVEAAALALACERSWTDLKSVPGGFETLASGLRLQVIGGVPLLGLEDLPVSRLLNRALKRGVDVVGAFVGLLLSAPVILVLSLIIRRQSPGPVFFAQERLGADKRPFRMWKLRSMVPDAVLSDNASQSTPRGDPRVLPVGLFMRRWNLDELPQFWNVLCGDMSLVGPRPERTHHADRLGLEISHYFQRHIAKPGMTGWAQVNGLRGGCDLAKRVRFDHYYIENWSLWLDFQIVLMTFVRWRNPAE